MSAPRITAIAASSPAASAQLEPGDELLALNGRVPRDVIEYAQLADEEDLELTVRRGGEVRAVTVGKAAGLPLGVEVSSPVFDRVRTCDNHCSFCFIHQLPKGMRRSLYVKDDDYRLSFLYGNFTTLTRFTELDLERVVDQRLGPLYVSIHATDPAVRARMLRNPRGATSLRWLRALLEAGIEVHGQVVVCPGVNDGPVLEATLTDVLDEYPGLRTIGLVPLGVSRYTKELELRSHTVEEAGAVCDAVAEWQEIFRSVLGRRLVFAADEYYLMADRPFPAIDSYEDLAQHENGIGMARAFEAGFRGAAPEPDDHRGGFFASVDGAPAAGYRAPHLPAGPPTESRSDPAPGPSAAASSGRARGVAVITGTYGARVLGPLLDRAPPATEAGPRPRLVTVSNAFFGGNIGVAGLLTGADVGRVLTDQPAGDRYLLPDACLTNGRFLDGVGVGELPRPVEVVPADGASLRRALTEGPAPPGRLSCGGRG